jgi:hypothetical protein
MVYCAIVKTQHIEAGIRMKRTFLAVSAMALSTVAAAQASLTPGPAADVDPIQAANSHLAVLTGVATLAYYEYATGGGPYLDSETGALPALTVDAARQGTLLGIEDVYAQSDLTLIAGPTHYTGASLATGAPEDFNHCTSEFDYSLKLGKGFRVSPRLQVTPYFEYALRYWARMSQESYLENDLGAGVLTQFAVTSKLVVGADVALTKALTADVVTPGFTLHQPSNLSPAVTLSADYALTRRLHLVGSYQYRHAHYGQSKTADGTTYYGIPGNWYEPADRVTQNVVMAGVSWTF